jgi:hypothetical protein
MKFLIGLIRQSRSNSRSRVNRPVRDKIRQQLQILRDAKLLIHVGSGVWRLP